VNLALATFVTLAGLVGIEVYLRWQGAFEVNASAGCYRFSDDPKLLYEPTPHCEGANSLGMRDHEIDPAAPGGTVTASRR
jgi:hypothetical protein